MSTLCSDGPLRSLTGLGTALCLEKHTTHPFCFAHSKFGKTPCSIFSSRLLPDASSRDDWRKRGETGDVASWETVHRPSLALRPWNGMSRADHVTRRHDWLTFEDGARRQPARPQCSTRIWFQGVESPDAFTNFYMSSHDSHTFRNLGYYFEICLEPA